MFRLQNGPNTEEMNFDSGAQNALVGRIRLGEPLPAYTIGAFNDQDGSPRNRLRLDTLDEFIQNPSLIFLPVQADLPRSTSSTHPECSPVLQAYLRADSIWRRPESPCFCLIGLKRV